MADLPDPADLPPGFEVVRGDKGILVVRSSLAAAFEAAGFGPEGDGTLLASDLSGRAALGQLELGGEAFVVRAFRHGGLLRWVTGDRYRDAERPFRELALTERLRALGLPAPEMVAARAQRVLGGYRLAVVSRRLHDTLDGGEWLECQRAGELDARVRGTMWTALGRLVGQMHALGLEHADLQPRNVLFGRASLTGATPELWGLDFEGSTLHAELPDSKRHANLARLARGVGKREARGAAFLWRTDGVRFFRGYGAARPEGRTLWKDDWRAVARILARGKPIHGAGRWLERAVGADPAVRDGSARVRDGTL